MKITPHFSSGEFDCRDGTPYPVRWLESRLHSLCVMLEIIREEFGGRPLSINSGYRTAEYNRSIGGARASQHVEGRAADIRIKGVSPGQVHDAVLRLYNEGKLNIGGLGAYPTFTHVDVRPADRLARWGGSRTEN
jgi:uncharacterized protein YcbK (DUF882 family)